MDVLQEYAVKGNLHTIGIAETFFFKNSVNEAEISVNRYKF
jgi:hypothetical protein